MISDSTMLVTLTAGELRSIIDERVQQALHPADSDPLGPLVWGNKALAEFLGCTPAHASVITQTGKYEGAIVHPHGSRRVAFYPKLLKQMIQNQSQEQQ